VLTEVRRAARPATRRALATLVTAAVVVTLLVVDAAPAGAHTPHDVIGDVAVSPNFTRDRTVLVISDARVLRSTDGGRHYRQSVEGIDPTIPPSRFGFAPSAPRVVYLSSLGAGIYRSDDGGLHWRAIGGAPGFGHTVTVAVSPRSADVVVVQEGLFGSVERSEDGGRTWAPVAGVTGIGALAFVPGRPGRMVAGDRNGRLLVSDDDGRSFRVSAGSVAGRGPVTAIAVGVDGVVFAGTRGGAVLRSEDAGASWSHAGGPLGGPPIDSLLVSSGYARDHTVWASTWHRGAYRSTDGGRTWRRQHRGLTGDAQAALIRTAQFRSLASAPLRGRRTRLFLAGYDGLFTSTDRGRRWSEIQTQADYISGLAVSPDYHADRTVAATTYVKGAFISRNGGRSFMPSDRGIRQTGLGEGNKVLPIRRLHNVAFSPDYARDRTIFTATWTNFVKSVDGGRTWKRIVVAPPPKETPLRQFVIAVSPQYRTDRTIYLGTRQGDLYVSTRGGEAGSWTTATDLKTWIRTLALSPDFARDHTMFAGTEKGVMRSTDAGRTWTHTGPTTLALVAISPDYDHDHTVFAGTHDGLDVTRDGGATWTRTGPGPFEPARGVAAVAVSPSFAQDGTVLLSIDGVGLFRSRDRGTTFDPVGADLRRRGLVIADFDRPTSVPIQFSRSFATDHTVYAYAQTSLLRSTDAGDHWTVLALPDTADVRHDLHRR
jgi:photosystem II stability/assembly factor-like uncharacterized protein